MKNLPSELLEKVREATKAPEGTVEFVYTFEKDLFDPSISGGIIFDLVSGGHYFRLERTDNLMICFYHTSPGTGTRVASVNLREVKQSNKFFFAFTWSPEEIHLYVGPQVEGGELVHAVGIPSEISFRVGKGNTVLQEGDRGIRIMGTRFNRGGKQIVKPAALNAWEETKKAIEILLMGESKDGFIFEIVRANLSIVMMVTGFEAYCKTRFDEVEQEGIQADHERMANKLVGKKENFQDFDGYCKDIYNLGFGIKFGELANFNELSQLKQIFTFRSRIVHASPLLTMVNEFKVPSEKPVFSNEIVQSSLELFDKFINKLHRATLNLRMTEK